MKINEILSEDMDLRDKQRETMSDAYKTLVSVEGGFDDLIKSLSPQEKKLVEHFTQPGHRIYRGMKSTGILVAGDGNLLNRMSANTDNYYTLWIDNMKAWSKFPRRSKSFICSTNSVEPKSYGSLYQVIPLENQPIGICPTPDFWGGFDRIHDVPEDLAYGNSLPGFNSLVKNVGNYCAAVTEAQTSAKNLSETNYEEFRAKIEEMDVALKSISDGDVAMAPKWYHELMEEIATHGSFPNYLNWLLDPKGNEFGIINANRYHASSTNEVWLSGKVLFIPDNIVRAYL